MNPGPTPEQKSLKYAEDLGLNSVYEDALLRRKEVGDKHLALHSFRSNKRELENIKVDLEMAVIEEERRKNPDMSVAAMEKHLKVVFSHHEDIRDIRDQLVALQSDIDFTEFEIEVLNTDIKIAVARLHELGGYFQFMAVIKQAHEARKARDTREADKDPWK